MTKPNWALSLAIHCLLLAFLFALTAPAAQQAAPMRWEVALLPPPPLERAAPAPPPVATAPPPRAVAASLPARVPTPQPAPAPVPVPTPAAPVAAPEPVVPVAAASPAPVSVPTVAATATPIPEIRHVAAAPPAPVVEAAPPKPAQAPPPRVDAEVQRRWYAALTAKLTELKRYPLVARRMGQEGVVLLEALIHPNGQAEAEIKQGSGHSALDRAALALFQEAILALPENLSPPQASRLAVPIAYRLEH